LAITLVGVTTTRLMILGLVKWLQPVHGYDVRRELLSWNVEDWASIAPGSIYHALRKLTEEGLLAEVATEQVGSRPARTTYRVTAKGDMEFEELLRRYWWQYAVPVDPFQAAFAFLPALPRRESSAALRNRARILRAAADGLAAATDQDWAREDKPEHVRLDVRTVGGPVQDRGRLVRAGGGPHRRGRGLAKEEVAEGALGRWRDASKVTHGHDNEK
jgi:DNA-binding PadR family transcriptional regulator